MSKSLLDGPKARVTLLGAFHFSKPGLDMIKESFEFDTFSQQRQQEIKEVVECLTRFQPTKVAIEESHNAQRQTDEAYQNFQMDPSSLSTFEGHQIGFRVAKHFGHETVYAIDSTNVKILSSEEGEQLEREMETVDPGWLNSFHELSSKIDHWISTKHLREALLNLNQTHILQQIDAAYYKLIVKVGGNESYLGADWMAEWFNRNLRIFRNIQRITESDNERILVIIGSGHVPILKYLLESSPEFEVVDVREFLQNKG